MRLSLLPKQPYFRDAPIISSRRDEHEAIIFLIDKPDWIIGERVAILGDAV